MNYSSTFKVASKKYPGVEFTLLRMTDFRKTELEKLQAEPIARLIELEEQMEPIAREYRAWKAERLLVVNEAAGEALERGPELETNASAAAQVPAYPRMAELVAMSNRVRQIDELEIEPIAVTYAVQEIHGLVIDGAGATLELLRRNGPDGVYRELVDAVQMELKLTPEEREKQLVAPLLPGVPGGGAQ